MVHNVSVSQKVADAVEHNVDPDQTVPHRSGLIRVCTVCKAVSVPILRIFMVACLRTGISCKYSVVEFQIYL